MKYLFICFAFLSAVSAEDANCTNNEISGYWLFDESLPLSQEDIKCPQDIPVPLPTHQVKIQLKQPNVAVDAFGNKGVWTSVYGWALEVTVNYRKYFAYLYAHSDGSSLTSKCNETVTGLSHDVLGHNWACFRGRKVENFDDLTFISKEKTHLKKISVKKNVKFQNGKPLYWKPPPALSDSEETKRLVASLPDFFDWRNVSGVNYLPPISQQVCSDCYAHASVAALSARVRIATKNSQTPRFSVQQIIDCSTPNYSSGCNGGWPYTVAGMFAQEYGLLEEDCYPYTGEQGICSLPKNDSLKCKQRVYTAKFNYIGGYFGGCNEDLMLLELVENGPFTVAVDADDFNEYDKSVYSECQNYDYEVQVDHAVVIVGYGVDKASGKKYWIVQNSWGTSFGIDGFIYIERGVDMCGIESLGLSVRPIPVI